MFKILIKKQMRELFSSYVIDRKTGKRKSRWGIIGTVALMTLIFLSVAFIFVSYGYLACEALVEQGLDWVYFSMFAIITVLFGTFGSVFNTYAGLYKAKDNELLLSLPIPSASILLSRLVGVLSMSLLYGSLVWLPCIIIYWILAAPTALSVIYSILLILVLTLFVAVLTCLLGWVVAYISVKLRFRKFLTLLISLLFLGGYMWMCTNMDQLLTTFLMNGARMGEIIHSALYPMYLLGTAAAGSTVSMAVVTLSVLILCGVCFAVMSKTFRSFVISTPKDTRKAEYKARPVKVLSVKTALLRREAQLFTGSTTYMLNCGLGLVILPVLSVILFLRRDLIMQLIPGLNALLPNMDPVSLMLLFLTCAVCMCICTGPISAPSVSLEGKKLWILQTLPVSSYDILKSKEMLHVCLCAIPTVIPVIVSGVLLEAGWTILPMLAVSLLFVWFTALLGLFAGILKPNLTWTSEAIPVKQGLPVAVVLFGGYIICAAFIGLYFLVSRWIGVTAYLCILAAILLLADLLLQRWLKTKGSRIFAAL